MLRFQVTAEHKMDHRAHNFPNLPGLGPEPLAEASFASLIDPFARIRTRALGTVAAIGDGFNHRLGMVTMQKLRVLGLGVLMVTMGCTDDRRVVGNVIGASGGLPSVAGGQPGTLTGAGGNSGGTGLGLGGTRAVSGTGATNLAGSSGSSPGTGLGLGGTQAVGGASGTSLAGSGGNLAGAGTGIGGTKATGGAGGTSLPGSGGSTAAAGAGLGGTNATGGTSAVAGTLADEICTASPVKLQLTSSTPSAYCVPSCGGFVSIYTADSQPLVSLGSDPCSSEVFCSNCSTSICTNLYCGPMVMSSGSASITWQGAYGEASTCGQNVACSHGRCVASGHYIAHFCATAATSSGCDVFGAQTCIDVPFDFPTSTTVQAVLPALAAAGGSTGSGGSGPAATGGSPGSGGTGATGGSLGAGGSTSASTAGAGGVCNSGCTVEGTDSTWCATPNTDLVCWGPFPSNLASIMQANGCTTIPTDAVRFCCPSQILTQCQ